MDALLRLLAGALESDAAIEVAWVYGSVARGDSDDHSDIDLAIAFREQCADPWERVDALRAELQRLQSQSVSIIDLNRAPTPLAYNVIQDGRVLLCRNPLRLHAEQQRIWSLWEEYRGEHERIRTAS